MSRVGEFEISAFRGGAGAADVGGEHIWESVEGGLIPTVTRDGDGSAVHVHLAVANLVEPGPGEGGLAGWEIVRDLESKLSGAVAVWIGGKVARGVGGAASDDGVDDFERALLGGILVVGDAELAGATTVDGAAEEAQGLGRAERHLGAAGRVVRTSLHLAWEVAAIAGQGRVVEAVIVVGLWGFHLHVGIDGREAEGQEERRCGEEMHFRMVDASMGLRKVSIPSFLTSEVVQASGRKGTVKVLM